MCRDWTPPSSSWCKLEEVVCRSERRADERPMRMRLDGRWVEIYRVRSSWLERGFGEADLTYRVFAVDSELGPLRLRVAVDGWVWELSVP